MLDFHCKDPLAANEHAYTRAGFKALFLTAFVGFLASVQSLTGSLATYNLTDAAFCVTLSSEVTFIEPSTVDDITSVAVIKSYVFSSTEVSGW